MPKVLRVVGVISSLALAAALAAGCASSRPAPATEPAAPAEAAAEPAAPVSGAVRVTLLHLNDIYEITPVGGGKSGGPARVATLLRELEAENPNTYAVLAGDLFSPSALGTAMVDGEPLAGRQMVAVLNAVGLDLATFGNHEFDISEEQFYERLAESEFPYVSANVFDAEGDPFPGVAPHAVITAQGADGSRVRVAFIGVTLDANRVGYVRYTDVTAAVKGEVEALAGQADVLVGLTHLAVEEDIRLAEDVPQLDLILGGHEHENVQLRRGTDFTPILKADANVRSVWVHELLFHPETGRLDVDSRFVLITDAIPEDPHTREVVDEWVEKGYAGFRKQGFEPEEVVAITTEILDGREAVIRDETTRLTEIIADSLLHEAAGAELALYNSGSIRIDDEIPPGSLTQYDVLRILPFSGRVLTAEISGSLLKRTLIQGEASRGTGGFLQAAQVTTTADGSFLIAGQPLEAGRTYTLAVNDYLASGKENDLEFLKPGPDLRILKENRDLRPVLMDELRRVYGEPGE